MKDIRAWAALAPLAALLSSCGHAPLERKIVNDAAQALGGKDRILAVKTLTMEGQGIDTNLGQNVTPEGELPVWKVTEYRQTIDPAGGRMRIQQVRAAQFLFALATVQKLDQGLDGDVAYNVSPDGNAVRAPDAAARERRIALLHHPLTIIRAALDPAARLSNQRRHGSQELIDITTSQGDVLTLAIDSATGLPARVISMSDNPNLGDVAVETTFSEYQDVNGLKLPKHLDTRVDKYPQFDLRVISNVVDGGASALAAPEAVKAAPPPAPPPVVVTAEPVAKGIWWLAGSGNHRSILFEFGDHLTLFEVPLNEARSKAVIDKARSVVPGKPLTQAIVSHHHFDHSGGLRVAVAEGLTIVTYRGNIAFFQDLIARKHAIAPDELAKKPQPARFLPVDDELTLKDKTMEVRLYHLIDNPREGTNLFAYVPRDRILVQADLYDSTWTQYPWADNVLRNVALRGLRVEKDVPVHGEIQTWAEVVKTMGSRGAGGER
jgi:Metallo-beta-lactamase superfamily